MAATTFIDEVAVQHDNDKEGCEDKNMRKGRFDEIVKELRAFRNISDSVTVSKRSIECRVKRGNLVVTKESA